MSNKISKSDGYIVFLFFLIAIPVSFVGYDNSGETYLHPVLDTIIYAVFTCIVTYSIVYVLFPRYFPSKQILLLFVLVMLLLIICGYLELISYRLVSGKEISFSPKYIFWAIMSSAQNSGILIGILLGKKFYDAQLDLQKREKEKKHSELRLLKSQIDPHFLFNNLNTVDALIDKNKDVAKEYLKHLSSLYRYLISTKDDELVSLNEELYFAKDYIYLIEKRFGDVYKFEIHTVFESTGKLIPPGALQTILENVVKHNAGRYDEPVVTNISIFENEIAIKNNIQLKNKKAPSTNTGLSNLESRYKLLTDKEMYIHQDSEYYKIIIPILKAVD